MDRRPISILRPFGLAAALRTMLLALTLAVMLGASAGHAQSGLTDEEFHQLTQRWHNTLDSINDDLDAFTIVGDGLEALRENIRIVAESAQEERDRAATAAARMQRLLDALGPAPAEDQPPEDPIVATERSLIRAQLSHDLARAQRAGVVLARVESLSARTVEEETAALLDSLQERSVSPMTPTVVASGFDQLRNRFTELRDMIARSWRTRDATQRGAVPPAIPIIAAALLLALPLRSWLLRRYGPDASVEEPSDTQRFEAALVVAAASAGLPALMILVAQAAVDATPVFVSDLRMVVDIFLTIALETVPLLGLISAVLAPKYPQWRISWLADQAAVRAYRAIRLYAVLYLLLVPCLVAISPFYSNGRLIQIIGLRSELAALGALVGVLVIGVATLNLMRPRNWRLRPHEEAEGTTEPAPGRWIAKGIMALLVLTVIATMALAALGYTNLAVFISRSMIRTLVLLGYVLTLRALLYQGLRVATLDENALGGWVRHRFMLDDSSTARLVFWLRLTIDVAAGMLLLATVLTMWGLPPALLDQAFDLVVNGIDVGGFSISIVSIGLAVGVLVLSLAAVRLLQQFLSDRVLVQTRLELGVRDALATGISYVGYVIAILITLAVLGLNVGNIALIFGALSVGIGFGLQHVVSNFVSGLILLVQRPIKTGDWIVVGDQQGYVKRISVISTEIQTFDAAAVIIPNSTMLSSQVTNWHLHNKLGRVIVAVGVSYDCDPEQVRTVLLTCADETREILNRPAPQVLFRNFGDSALEFELRFFLRVIDDLLRVGSELRFAIKKAFDEAGIQIPYPQRDVHIRDGRPPEASETTPAD
ncbi:MAG: mechanosensitive ion channel domain-containing protein [Pseudomonadota bacterium]